MKVIFFLCVLLSFTAFSQRQVSGVFAGPQSNFVSTEGAAISLLCDTISHVVFGVDSTVLYLNTGTGNWGYISGSNSYKDIAKAEKFFASEYTSGYQLAGGIFHFAKAVDGSSPTTMQLAAWKNDGAGFYPQSKIASSAVAVSAFNQDTAVTTLLFANPVPVSGDFYLGIEGFAYANPQQDTVAIYTSASTTIVNTAYEQWVDSSWHAFDEPNNWNFKSNFFIAAILCNSDVGSYEILNPSDKLILFPNPGRELVTLNTGSIFSGKTRVEIFNTAGTLVFSEELNSVNGNIQLPTSSISPGVYQVTVAYSNAIRHSRLVIQ